MVGAGPVGLTLALQAHHYGATVGVVERRATVLRPSRAMLLWPRTLQALGRLGVAAQLQVLPAARLEACLHLARHEVPVALADLAAPRSGPPPLMVRQADLEAVLRQALRARGIPLLTGTELTRVRTDDHSPVATLMTGEAVGEVRCAFVVGCDGADSSVRRLAGIPWRGRTYRQEAVLADLDVEHVDASVAHIGAGSAGVGFLFPAGEHGAAWRLVATRVSQGTQIPAGRDGPPVPDPELHAVLRGANLPGRVTRTAWSTRVRLQLRRAASYRSGPVFLAGDAAHVFSPAGAQGMNTGIQDATNLGWKLAVALRGSADQAGLLASYEAERRPVARQVGMLTDLLLRGEGDDRLPFRLARTAVLPALAPALPGLLRRRLVTGPAGWVLSQGWVRPRPAP